MNAPRTLPQQLGGFQSIAAALDYAAAGKEGLRFFSTRGEAGPTLSYRQLLDDARTYAGALREKGLRRGDHVALIAETSPAFLSAFYACQYAGIIPCPLPFSGLGDASAAHTSRLRTLVTQGLISAVVAKQSLAKALADALCGGARIITFEALADSGTACMSEATPHPTAYVQFSSGSTAQPKGIIISQRAIMANSTAILRHGMKLTPDDRAFSWLPLYHDMGLVGFSIAPLCGQCSVDYMSPSAFARRPALWPKLISSLGSTISYSPTFGYDLSAGRTTDDERACLDLSRWRVAGIGGDTIRPDALQRFADRFSPCGFRREAFLPSYGLAETTLAATFSHEPDGFSTDTAADGRSHVICGSPLPDHDLIITDDEGEPLPERKEGNVLLRGASLMTGYLADTEATAATLSEGGLLHTGDRGYLTDGKLVITGRSKDMMLVNGRNIWPEDVEAAALSAAGMRHGEAVAFARECTGAPDEIILLLKGADDITIRRQVTEAVAASVGVACHVAFVSPRAIPLTSSGKLQRARAKQMWVSGDTETISV